VLLCAPLFGQPTWYSHSYSLNDNFANCEVSGNCVQPFATTQIAMSSLSAGIDGSLVGLSGVDQCAGNLY
jgi:hypothetical protein